MDVHALRHSVLVSYGASSTQIDELLVYNQNRFKHDVLSYPLPLPLPPEPHIHTWEAYATDAACHGVFNVLQTHLVQWQFPIGEGMSQNEAYLAATRKGLMVAERTAAPGLQLHYPEALRLLLHDSPAGRIPVLVTACRDDFVTLVQACLMRNEPKPIPAAMGACMISGFNNWQRLHTLKQRWQAAQAPYGTGATWAEEFRRLLPQKALYQDRFIIVSDGPYSNVSAADLGLDEAAWHRMSLHIRIEHECVHYFTRRLFNFMHNTMRDELMADYAGIAATLGYFRADWFLHFIGLEAFPRYRDGGRLQNYRGEPPLSDGALILLQALIKDAAEHLEQFDRTRVRAPAQDAALMLMVLSRLTLEELAAAQAGALLQEAWQDVQGLVSGA